MKLNAFLALVEEDSSGILHNVPNSRYRKWGINSLGFRGKEIALAKKEGQIRIVCLGGSETFGFYESEGKEWPSQLREMLRGTFPTAEVINASVVGLHPKNRKDYIEKYVLPLKPDIMILFRQRLFEYVIEGIRRKRRKHLPNKVKRKKKINPIKESLSHAWGLKRLREILERCVPERLITHIRIWRLHRKVRKKEKRYLIDKEPLDKVPENIILEYEKDLGSFIHFLKENNVVPVLSTYPRLITSSNKDTYKNISLATRSSCIELSENGFIDVSIKFDDVARRIAREQNVALLDIDNSIPKTQEYFADNYHYTNRGAEIIAKNIYGILIQTKLIK
jgi:lysophospholipase L1-like esterase